MYIAYTPVSTDCQQNILLAVYCYTACDSTRSIYGHGKKAAYRIMMKEASQYAALSLLGCTLSLEPLTYAPAVAFVDHPYRNKGCQALDSLRCEKSETTQTVQPKKHPPTDNSFWLHVLRCMYQLMIWCQAIIWILDLADPSSYGYTYDSSKLMPLMMSQPPAPPELLNSLICDCVGGQCHINCSIHVLSTCNRA